jgi:hypothetical protein
MFPSMLKRRAITVACWIAVFAVVLWGGGAFIDYSTSLAIVAAGMNPGLAAADAEALAAAAHPTEVTPSISELKASRRVLFLTEGTKVRELRAVSKMPCQGEHYPASVKVLDGALRGRTLWMCSDSFAKLYKWP